MTHEIVKRVAAAIAEPKRRYIVKYYQPCGSGVKYINNNQWQIRLIDGSLETSIVQFDISGHDEAEAECERLNNEMLARLAIEAMKDLYKCIGGPLGNSNNDTILGNTIDMILNDT